jgi:hypothetical protein
MIQAFPCGDPVHSYRLRQWEAVGSKMYQSYGQQHQQDIPRVMLWLEIEHNGFKIVA